MITKMTDVKAEAMKRLERYADLFTPAYRHSFSLPGSLQENAEDDREAISSAYKIFMTNVQGDSLVMRSVTIKTEDNKNKSPYSPMGGVKITMTYTEYKKTQRSFENDYIDEHKVSDVYYITDIAGDYETVQAYTVEISKHLNSLLEQYR